MSIPSRAVAAQVLRGLDPPGWLLTHSAAVAEVASFLADRIERQGHTIDVRLVEAAALLHDLDKALPRTHPLSAFEHGEGGARWARQAGHGELAPAIAHHPVHRLMDDERYHAWDAGATIEERVVAYADKRSMQDLVSIDERFTEWEERHGLSAAFDVARQRAAKLEIEVCAAAGIAPHDVRRAPWVGEQISALVLSE